ATAVRTLRSTDSANFSRSRCRIRAILKARAEELSPPAPAKGVYSDAAEGQSASVSNPTLRRIDVRFGSFAERRTIRRHVRSALRSGHRLMPKQRSVRAQAAATDVRGRASLSLVSATEAAENHQLPRRVGSLDLLIWRSEGPPNLLKRLSTP